VLGGFARGNWAESMFARGKVRLPFPGSNTYPLGGGG